MDARPSSSSACVEDGGGHAQDTGIHWTATAVKNRLNRLHVEAKEEARKSESYVGRISAFYELFLKLRKPSHEEEMQMYHTVRDIVEARQKFDGYAEVCARLTHSDGYLPTGTTTDFDSLLKERLHDVENENRSEPGHSDVEGLQEMFVDETRIPLSAITGRFDEDDDILEVGGASRSSLAKNLRCPITMVDILNLREPVEDSVGYVYEQEAIKALIYKKGRKGKTSIPCPEAGTQHTVSLSDLRPARKVLEAKARAAMHTSG